MTQTQNKPSGYFPESFYFYAHTIKPFGRICPKPKGWSGYTSIPHSQILLQESLLYVENPLL